MTNSQNLSSLQARKGRGHFFYPRKGVKKYFNRLAYFSERVNIYMSLETNNYSKKENI